MNTFKVTFLVKELGLQPTFEYASELSLEEYKKNLYEEGVAGQTNRNPTGQPMKYIHVKLTEDQARYLNRILSYEEGWVQNNEYPRSESNNAFTERIRVKIFKQLELARYQRNLEHLGKLVHDKRAKIS